MKIHVFGASGSGVTTLGNALAQKLHYPYFDNDNYFWEPSEIPFTLKRNPERRNNMLLQDLAVAENYVVGGSMVSWGEEWLTHFDLAVFLLLPRDIRLERLKKREHQRYGDVIYSNPERNKKYNDFITWASGYDENTTKGSEGKASGRTIKVHRDWMENLSCDLLEIAGDFTTEERMDKIVQFIQTNNKL